MDYQKLIRRLLAGGDRHSALYIDGMEAALRLRIDAQATSCPYPQGTPEFDAFFYGCNRGADEFRNALNDADGNRAEAIASLCGTSNVRRTA